MSKGHLRSSQGQIVKTHYNTRAIHIFRPQIRQLSQIWGQIEEIPMSKSHLRSFKGQIKVES